MRARWLLPTFALPAVLACSRLTAPPTPEPIASDTVVTAATVAPAASSAAPAPTPTPVRPAEPPPSIADLKKVDVVVGKGPEAKAGDVVSVHYVGTLPDGKKFDASRDHGKPFEFPLVAGRVIKGWDLGVAGMKVGGKRKLTIPYQLAYGEEGSPPVIPPKATLLFEIELLEIKKN